MINIKELTCNEAQSLAHYIADQLICDHDPLEIMEYILDWQKTQGVAQYEPNWADIPLQYKYFAIDIDGRGHYYQNKPFQCDTNSQWDDGEDIENSSWVIAPWYTDWRNSLQERPKSLSVSPRQVWQEKGSNHKFVVLGVSNVDAAIQWDYSHELNLVPLNQIIEKYNLVTEHDGCCQ